MRENGCTFHNQFLRELLSHRNGSTCKLSYSDNKHTLNFQGIILPQRVIAFLLCRRRGLKDHTAPLSCRQLHQPRLWFITGGYLVKSWFIPVAARARGQSNDLNREILASKLFNCLKEVINAPPVPSISRCIHIVYRHKNLWEYQRSNFIYQCMSTSFNYVHSKDALLDYSAPGGERCESLTWVDEISYTILTR